MRIALIWAMDKNRVIGQDNGLPWRLSSDLTHFKRVTLGKPIIMGRKTWDSLGRPLPGRPNFVVSRMPAPADTAAIWCASLDEAISAATTWAQEQGVAEVIVMGGAQIYQQAFPMADRLYITEVATESVGDTRLPVFDLSGFVCTECSEHPASERDDYAFSVMHFDKTTQ